MELNKIAHQNSKMNKTEQTTIDLNKIDKQRIQYNRKEHQTIE